MGSGADAAIEAADVVFMTSSMEAIPQSLKIARATEELQNKCCICAGDQSTGHGIWSAWSGQYVDGCVCGYRRGGDLYSECNPHSV